MSLAVLLFTGKIPDVLRKLAEALRYIQRLLLRTQRFYLR